MARGIDVIPRDHGRPVGQLEPLDSIAVSHHFDDLSLLPNLSPKLLRVMEQDLVIDSAIHLEGRLPSETFVCRGSSELLNFARWRKIEIPEFGILTPPIGGADLQRKSSVFDLVPAAHLMDDSADRG